MKFVILKHLPGLQCLGNNGNGTVALHTDLSTAIQCKMQERILEGLPEEKAFTNILLVAVESCIN